jgi:hypothetical protein
MVNSSEPATPASDAPPGKPVASSPPRRRPFLDRGQKLTGAQTTATSTVPKEPAAPGRPTGNKAADPSPSAAGEQPRSGTASSGL